MKKEELHNCQDFINDQELLLNMESKAEDVQEIRDILEKSLSKERLSRIEVAKLLNNKNPEIWNEIYSAAKQLKENIYGNRMVLFAPLYIGNKCINNCAYCGFSKKNKIERITLSKEELESETSSLAQRGHKRIIIVYGESPDYDGERIANDVNTIYSVKEGRGEIRRVNINAAPMDVYNYKKIAKAGIGTYQIFQETYHHATYKKVHLKGLKSIYKWRITGLDRAMEAGIDDVGIGALFGLYDYRFEVMGLLKHTEHLEHKYNVGPHTISFPRLTEVYGGYKPGKYAVSDEQLKQVIAVLRLAVPYTGLILTARENAVLRKEMFQLGVSQTDAGTNIEMKGYSHHDRLQNLKKEQFLINDSRSLDSVMQELFLEGYMPSFCTGCYRAGRTGEHFMELSIPGFIHDFCKPNSIITSLEYLLDYASPQTRKIGMNAINNELDAYKQYNGKLYTALKQKVEATIHNKRDLYF